MQYDFRMKHFPFLGFLGVGIGLLFFAAIMIATFVFWIMMIVDVIKRDFKKSEEKIVWLLIILFFHFIGALVYYFMVKRQKQY